MRRWLLVLVLGVFNIVPSGALAAGPPATVAVWTGTPQSAAVNTNFGVAMVVVVRDSATNGVQGVTVTFAAPGAGASGTFGGLTTANVVTDNNGLAVAPTIRANGTGGSYSVTATVAGLPMTASFSLTNTGGGGGGTPVMPVAPSNLRLMNAPPPGPPSLTAVSGTPQSAVVNTAFATLQAVLRDSGGSPIIGAVVTFTAPSSGATALFSGTTTATATTNASGVASAPPPMANGTTGSYLVSASSPGAAAPLNFSLTNTSSGGGGGSGWTNVTPGGVDLTNNLDCSNYGTITMVADPLRPSNLYTQFNCQGVWRSTDFGLTWTGPINTGTGAAGVKGAGGLAIAPGPAGQPPILYSAGIRGTGNGFWRSLDGGVSWTNYNVAPSGSRQDFYPPVVDPYNGNHLVMNGHEFNMIVQSTNGGQTWTQVPMASGMNENGGTGFLFFVNTGNPATTANTWLWTAQASGGAIGTWRTSNGGSSWTRVDSNEHPHGEMQIYQPDASGVVYMAGVYSGSGWGVLRSTDFGQTWAHVGSTSNQAVVFGTPNRVYSMYAWACGHCTVNPQMQSAPTPGITGWTAASTPPGMAIGPAQVAVVFDGSRYVIVTANWLAGLWRYVE